MPRSSAAQDHSRSVEEKASAQKPETSVHPVEPEDPKTTGAGHARQRRVLGLNVGEGGHAQQHPETTAGQHATGSFTGGTEKKDPKKG
ncbi:MAG: hypothetical protein WB524_16070 [Acidobacteriaceae bacterium]|jgi:hypothetical protein